MNRGRFARTPGVMALVACLLVLGSLAPATAAIQHPNSHEHVPRRRSLLQQQDFEVGENMPYFVSAGS